MPLFHSSQIPPPKDWQEFEELCADLWQEILNSTNTELNGRTGQPQNGVDVFGQIGESTKWFGLQCKGKDGRYGDHHQVTEKELVEEVEKAKNFKPNLTRFILATTAPNDAKIQEIARRITVGHQAQGLFTVQVKSWDEIHREIAKYKVVIEKFYPDFTKTDNELLRRIEQATSAIEGAAQLPNSKLEDAHSKQIDSYRDLLNNGQPKTAFNLIIQFKNTSWDELSNYNKFRITTNIAACHLQLGEEEEAALNFIAAQKIEPNDEKALCNLVVANHLLGERKKAQMAANAAVLAFPHSAMANRLKVAASDFSKDDLPESVVPKELHHLPEICFAIGQAYLLSDRLEEAIPWLKDGYSKEQGDFVEVKSAYGSALLKRLYDKKYIAFGKQLNEEDKSELLLVDKILSEVWEGLKTQESIALNTISITNLLLTKFLLDETELGISIAKEALTKVNTDAELLKQATFLLMDAGKFNDAVLLVKDQYEQTPEKWALLYVEVLARDKQYSQALDIVQRYLSSDCEDKNREIALGTELKLLNVIEAELPESKILSAIEEYPESISILLDLSTIYLKNNQKDKAIELVASAKKLLTNATEYFTKLSIADELFNLEQYVDSASLYESLIVEYVDSEQLRKLIECYYSCNYRKKLIDLILSLPDSTRKINFYRQYAAAIFEKSGLYNEALTEIEFYLADNVNDLKETLHWFGLCLRIGQESKIVSHLKADIDYSSSDSIDYIRLAAFHCDYNEPSVGISLASKILFENYSDADVNMAYMQLFMSRDKEDDSFLIQSFVDENTLIGVKSASSEVSNYFISKTTGVFTNSIPLEHPISKASIGKKVGDFIKVSNNPYVTSDYKIISITSLPVFLFQRIMDSFSDRFPNYDKPFWKIDVKGNDEEEFDFTNFFKIIDAQKKHTSEVLSDYKTKQYPVCVLAKLLGKPILDVWIGMQTDTKEKVFNCVGTSDERDSALKLLSSNNTYLVDPLTLYSLFSLEFLDLAKSTLGPLAVTQSSIDFYNQLIAEQRTEVGKRSGTIGKTDDGYISYEKSESDTKYLINNYQSIVDWVTNNCIITPAIEKEHPSSTVQVLSDILDRSFYDSLIAAEGNDYILLTEDLRFRQLSKLVSNVDGVWLQPILIKARDDGKIRYQEYAKKIAALASRGLYFTSIDSESMASITENNDWQVNSDLIAMLATLGDEGSNLNSSFKVAINFLCGNLLSAPNEQIIYAILNGVTRHYCRSHCKEIIAAFISASEHIEYMFGQNISRWYLDSIYKWCQGYFIAHLFFKPTK
ncbi:MAG: hypothetical protein OCD00_14700 [Colwellia sp.]